ncbi:MAG: class I SAM-dependent methyltransferase [Paracoccaceae bacterium]
MSTAEDWAGDLGRRWAAEAERQDRMLAAFEAAGRAALGDVAGRRVLDLGCGPGASSFALARDGAETTGLDVSPDLLAVARARAAEPGAPPVAFVEGDAASARFEAPFDALFSRFGCMFFEDPVPAWRNLRAALLPGAPFVGVAWRPVKQNLWVFEPLKLIGDLLPPQPSPPPGAPGPFGWAEPALPGAWLAEAGWREVGFAEAEADIALGGETGASPPLPRAAEAIMTGGPLSRRILELPEDAQAEVRARLEAGLAPFVRDGAVRLPGRVWVATARA